MDLKSKIVLDEYIEECMLDIAENFCGRHTELSMEEMAYQLRRTAGGALSISRRMRVPLSEVKQYFKEFNLSDWHEEKLYDPDDSQFEGWLKDWRQEQDTKGEHGTIIRPE